MASHNGAREPRRLPQTPLFFRTIRWKLIVGTLVAIIVPLVFFAAISGRLLWAFYAQELESQLASHGRLIADGAAQILAPDTPDDPVALAHMVEEWKQASQMRITLCDGDGIVQAAPQPELVGRHITEDLQPGMQGALTGTASATVWKSPTNGYEDTMYVNLPVYHQGRIVGAVRVAYTVSEIQTRLGRIETRLLWSVTGYAVLIVVCTVLLGTTIVRPVERLNMQARRLAEGDLSGEIVPEGSAEIWSLATTLDDMRRRLERLEFLRRRRVSDVSHEIRTPLASIRAIAETLQMHGEDDPAARDHFLGRIVAQTDRLASFVNQLLDLEQIESGRMALRADDIPLRRVIDAAAQTIEAPARRKGVELDLRGLDGGTRVHGDADRLTQVFVNLLENAVRYTPSGGAVEISASPSDARVSVAVRDTGCGIPSEDLPYIFERFYRVAKHRSVSSGGAGLGLCIVKEIVEAHGGEICADSRVGEGTTFHLTLPRG